MEFMSEKRATKPFLDIGAQFKARSTTIYFQREQWLLKRKTL